MLAVWAVLTVHPLSLPLLWLTLILLLLWLLLSLLLHACTLSCGGVAAVRCTIPFNCPAQLLLLLLYSFSFVIWFSTPLPPAQVMQVNCLNCSTVELAVARSAHSLSVPLFRMWIQGMRACAAQLPRSAMPLGHLSFTHLCLLPTCTMQKIMNFFHLTPGNLMRNWIRVFVYFD